MGVLAAFIHSRGSNLESIDSAGFVKITRIRRRPRAMARHDDPVVKTASEFIEIPLK
jgi:hypothetical protein